MKQYKIAELDDYQQLAIRMAEDMTGCVLVAYEEAEASPRVLTAEELDYITALKDS